MREIAARFRGGPWNAVTRTIRAALRIEVREPLSHDPWAEHIGSDDGDGPCRVGFYVQNSDRPNQYDWDGWR